MCIPVYIFTSTVERRERRRGEERKREEIFL